MTAPQQQKPVTVSTPPSSDGKTPSAKMPMNSLYGQRKPSPGHSYRSNGSSQRVLDYLRKNPDIQVSYNEISENAGIRREVISNYIGHLIKVGVNITKPALGIVIYHSGHVTRLAKTQSEIDSPYPPAVTEIVKPTGPLYEFVASSEGITFVRDENMELCVIITFKEWMASR